MNRWDLAQTPQACGFYSTTLSESMRSNVNFVPARSVPFGLKEIGEVVTRYDLPFTKTEFSSIAVPFREFLFTNPAPDAPAGITTTPSTFTGSLNVTVKPSPLFT